MTYTFKISRRIAGFRALAVLGLLAIAIHCAPMSSESGLEPPPGALATLSVIPAQVTLTPSQTRTFRTSGTLSDGAPVSGFAVTWTATGGSISSDGQYSAGSTPGTYQVVGTEPVSGLSDTSSVTIASASIASLSIAPSQITLQSGQPQQFDVTATLADGSVDENPTVTWTGTGGTISAGGLYTPGNTAGNFRVIVTSSNGKADTSAVTVTTTVSTVTSVSLTPATVTLATGSRQQFTPTATLSNGSTTNVPVTWSVTGGTISNAGRYTAGSTAGAFQVIATTSNGMADTSAVNIIIPTITAVTVAPATASVPSGQTRQFTASARLSTGGTQSNPSVTWSATGGTISAGGLYTAGISTGSFLVIAAAANGVADTSAVTIPILTGVTLTPAVATINTAQTQLFTARGSFSDGSTGTVSVVWIATGGTVSSAGLYQPPATIGTYSVIAVQAGGTFADTSSVTVVEPPPPGAAHPNEPAGFSKLAYSSFTNSVTEDGWSGSGQAPLPTITSESPGADARMETPGSFGRATYRAGFVSGGEPVHFYRDISVSQIYGSYWMRRSSNFVYEQSGVNKLTFIWYGGNPSFFLNEDNGMSFWLQNGASPAGQNNPNVASGAFSKGVWHHVEYLLAGGNVKMWLDGTKIMDKTVNLGGSTAQKVEWAPYWGGNTGDRVPADQYLDIDDYYVSGQ